jgi:hypothetical protein
MVAEHPPVHDIPSNRISIVYTNDPAALLPDEWLTENQGMAMKETLRR